MPTDTKTPKQTVVEEGTEFKGTLKSSCAVVINGMIDGDVDAPEITVTRSGTVAGALRATKLRAQGTLSGKVEAGDVFLSGVVRSNTSIKAKRLEVKLGSEQAQIEVTFGECALEVGDVAQEAAVAAAPPKPEASTKSEAPPLLDAGASSDGWGLTTSDLGVSAAPGNTSRSSWKQSRSIEASAQDTAKSTLR